MAETAKPEWIASQRGSSSSLTLRRGVLNLEVWREVQSSNNPSTTPYAAKVFGARLAKTFATEEEAKEKALKAARWFLSEASAALLLVEGP